MIQSYKYSQFSTEISFLQSEKRKQNSEFCFARRNIKQSNVFTLNVTNTFNLTGSMLSQLVCM